MDFSWPAIAGAVSSLWGVLPAADINDPRAFLDALYAPQPGAERVLTADDVYSDRLETLFDDYAAHETTIQIASTEAPPPVDLEPFDPVSVIAASGPARISEPVIDNHRATAVVSFGTGNDARQLNLFLVEQDDGWRIDDVASTGSDGNPWLLSYLLRYDPQLAAD